MRFEAFLLFLIFHVSPAQAHARRICYSSDRHGHRHQSDLLKHLLILTTRGVGRSLLQDISFPFLVVNCSCCYLCITGWA
ncbi:unnamed protein product [Amoebophrya sp. A25]|nr:unnamed protein product [Amoebophrya sp. A25]|eukprot:GSA25T00014534001.1